MSAPDLPGACCGPRAAWGILAPRSGPWTPGARPILATASSGVAYAPNPQFGDPEGMTGRHDAVGYVATLSFAARPAWPL
jgi:hypothetical protein